MKVFKPTLWTTVKSLAIHGLLFCVIMLLLSYKYEFSWGFIGLLLLSILFIVMFMRDRVTKVEIDSEKDMFRLYYTKLFRLRVREYKMTDLEIYFTDVPSARGTKLNVLRLKSHTEIFDIEYGLNGWSKKVLLEIENSVKAVKR